MEELIGKSFKRNKYGLSSWTDIIKEIRIVYSLQSDNPKYIFTETGYFIPKIYVVGENNGMHYELEEIVLTKF